MRIGLDIGNSSVKLALGLGQIPTVLQLPAGAFLESDLPPALMGGSAAQDGARVLLDDKTEWPTSPAAMGFASLRWPTATPKPICVASCPKARHPRWPRTPPASLSPCQVSTHSRASLDAPLIGQHDGTRGNRVMPDPRCAMATP